VAALASGFIAAALGPSVTLPLYVAMVVLGVLLAVVDLACKRLPHSLVVPSIWVTGALFAIVAALTGAWGSWVRAVIAGAILFVVFLALWLVPGQGLGFGDVKLAALLGLFLGWLSWGAVLLGGLLPWLVNGPIVVALLILRRVGRKTVLPFGPAMLAGAMLSIVCVAWLQTWADR
jgi:leader peptidase (prepilin peptidase)/N-methyltransferase